MSTPTSEALETLNTTNVLTDLAHTPLDDGPPSPVSTTHKRSGAFWLSLISVVLSVFISALDLTAVATVIPTITEELGGGNDFTWIGSAYALSSTAILPLTGCLADIFGRRPVMLVSIAFLALGSALCGAAQNMTMLIAGRGTRSHEIHSGSNIDWSRLAM